MLIAAVMPITPIDKLPQGLYDCTGHVINLPQDCNLPFELEYIQCNCQKRQYYKLINTLNSVLNGNVITQANL